MSLMMRQQGIGRDLTMSRNSRCSAVRSVSRSELGHADDAVHGRANFVAHVGEKLAFGLAGGFGGVLGDEQRLFGAGTLQDFFLEFARAFLDAGFEAVMGQLEFGVAMLNLTEHFVEAIEEQTDFVVEFFGDAQGIIRPAETADAARARSEIGSEMIR